MKLEEELMQYILAKQRLMPKIISSKLSSNNKKLNIGDKIYVTDLDGKRMTYTIYDKFETDDTDTEYMTRDTQGAVEISLTTCTDDSKARLIILAKADA